MTNHATCRATGRRLAGVLIAVVCGHLHADTPDFDCMIEPLQVIEVRSPVIGLINEVHVQRGDLVSEGQLLVTIDSRVERSAADAARLKAEAQGTLRRAEARLQAARKSVDRNRSLQADGYVSTQTLDQALEEEAIATAEVQAAQENLAIAGREYREAVEQVRRRELRSSISGVVMDQYLYPGSLVDNSEGKKPILKLAQTGILKVESIVPFDYYQRVSIGDRATITPESPLTQTYQGVVKIIDRVVDSASGTFGVVTELRNPDYDIPAGIRCKAVFSSLE